jgi:plastocyanin
MKRSVTLVSLLFVLGACGDGTGPGGVRTVDVTAALSTLLVGQSVQLNATARDASGAVVAGAVSWTTSDATIATVSGSGLVSALTSGQVTITARIGGVPGSLQLAVANPSNAAIVSMPGFSFTPFTTTINVGGTVIFEFPAEPHNVIFAAVTGAPANIPTTSNRDVPRTFPAAGTFPYDCVLHPGMSGVVVVR